MADRKRTFKIMEQAEVPTGRRGKHNDIVHSILDDLKDLPAGKALKIPLSELPDTKVNIRSALGRAARKLGTTVATSADEEFLYVWNESA